MSLASRYKSVQVETASPPRLMMMFFEGALANMHKGRNAIEAGDYHTAIEALERAANIVIELNASLKDDAAPELSGRLHEIYDFVINRLVRASVGQNVQLVDEALRVFTPIKDGFAEACAQIASGQAQMPDLQVVSGDK